MIQTLLGSRFYPSGLVLVVGIGLSAATFWITQEIVQGQLRDAFHLTVSFEARALRASIAAQERRIQEAAAVLPALRRSNSQPGIKRFAAQTEAAAYAGLAAMFYEVRGERTEIVNRNRRIDLPEEALSAAEACSRTSGRICPAGSTDGEEFVLVMAADDGGRILALFSLPRLIQSEFQNRALYSRDNGAGGYMEVVMLEIAGVKRNLYFPLPEDFESGAARLLPPFVLAGGLIISILLFIVFRSLAEARNRALDLAEKMTVDLRAATQKAVEANRAKSEFLASMSHEIRNPLNVIAGMGEILAGTPLAGEQTRYLNTLRNAGMHLQSLINDILDLSRIESGQLELETIDLDLHAALQSVYDLYRLTAQEKGLEFRLEIADSVPRVIKGDPVRLRQIVVNLLGNAFKFTEKGSVTLRAARDGLLTISVADTGIGIPENKRAAIFEKFAQVDASTTRKYGGTGLGLAICKKLTEMMQGELRVESKTGEGSTFSFSLPVQEGRLEQSSGPLSPVLPGRHLRILLAEDSDDNALVVAAFLKALDHELVRAGNGREAVDLFRGGAFDLILMDNQMPEMDGLSAAREIRRIENGKTHTPILALTADSMKEDVERSMEAGCDGHVTKPITRTSLLAGIAGVIRP